MTYETKFMSVPDMRKFSEEYKSAIRDATDALLEGEKDAKECLNEAVLDAVELEYITADELDEMWQVMANQRLEGEFESEVVLQNLDAATEWSVDYFGRKKDGASTLDDFS